MNILFFGSAHFAIPTLHAIVSSKHKIVGVVTQPDKPAGRGQKETACPVALATRELRLKLFQPDSLKEDKEIQKLLSTKPDVLVVVAYGKLLPETLIRSVPKEAVNLHPSLLPKYRGAAPVQWSILNGDSVTGISTMKLASEMDTGNVYLQKEVSISAEETAEDLQSRLSLLGADLILNTLQGIENGSFIATPQDSSKVILAPKLTKEMGHLDFKKPAKELYNYVRGLQPWPNAYCFLGDKKINIFKAHIVEMSGPEKPGTILDVNPLKIQCGRGALELLEVQMEGKKRMHAREFLNGHPMKKGEIFT